MTEDEAALSIGRIILEGKRKSALLRAEWGVTYLVNLMAMHIEELERHGYPKAQITILMRVPGRPELDLLQSSGDSDEAILEATARLVAERRERRENWPPAPKPAAPKRKGKDRVA